METVMGDELLIVPARLIVTDRVPLAGMVVEPPVSVAVPRVVAPLLTVSVIVPGVPGAPGGLIGSNWKPLVSTMSILLPVVSVADERLAPAARVTVVEAIGAVNARFGAV